MIEVSADGKVLRLPTGNHVEVFGAAWNRMYAMALCAVFVECAALLAFFYKSNLKHS